MAGDERIMNESSLLMIHNAWTRVSGNAEALRKQAEDLEIITQASIKAYMTGATITEDKVKELMDNEAGFYRQMPYPGDLPQLLKARARKINQARVLEKKCLKKWRRKKARKKQ